MKESEIKILKVHVDAVLAALEKAGATRDFEEEMEVLYFDHPDERIRKANELLRLRKIGNRIEFVYKKNLRVEDGVKVADEYEVAVSNFETARMILEASGLQVAKSYTKKRTQYRADGAIFCLDRYEGLDPYLEIEASDTSIIEEWIVTLGLQKNERSTATMDELIEQKG